MRSSSRRWVTATRTSSSPRSGSGAGYVGLVASARRAATVLAELRTRGLDEESVLRVRAPAGLDLGPSSQEEIAVAILAELVAWRHARGESPVPAPAEAVDPVCGMTVALGTETEQTVLRRGDRLLLLRPLSGALRGRA